MSETLQKAVIYCRVSSAKQKTQGHGLESQEHRCRQFAAEKGLQVEAVFYDDISGGGNFAKRQSMSELLKFLKANKRNTYVICFDDIKRFSRDVYFYWDLIRQLDAFGAQPMSPNFVFEKTPEGRLQQSITVAAGEYERESNARQTRQKQQARLEKGYHAFLAPVGYKFTKDKIHGKIIVPDPAVAPILKEAMEGYASGRFQTTTEVRTFLENAPEFPKQASGKIGNSKAKRILTDPLYAGMIEHKPWGVAMRDGHHEGIISYQTFCKIQDRLNGKSYAPTRKDINVEFPLRGAVACGECGNALTSCYSKSKTGTRHAYYLCQNRKCRAKGKSIRRDKMESEFEAILEQLSPPEALVRIAGRIFKTLWDARAKTQEKRKAILMEEDAALDRDIEKAVDLMMETSSQAVMKRIEERIAKLENQKLLLAEKIEGISGPARSFDEMYRTSMEFLKNPNKIWALGRFEDKRAVLKLAFSKPLTYDRNTGYRTPDFSLPFKVLGNNFDHDMKMAEREGFEPSIPG